MKQLFLRSHIPDDWASFIIRPVGYDTHDGVNLGYVLLAKDAEQARSDAEQRWGAIESVERDS